MELIPRCVVERLQLVRADLRVDVECTQEAERTTRHAGADEIEMDVHGAAPPEVDAAGDVEEPRQLCQAVAVRLRRNRGELVAKVVR